MYFDRYISVVCKVFTKIDKEFSREYLRRQWQVQDTSIKGSWPQGCFLLHGVKTWWSYIATISVAMLPGCWYLRLFTDTYAEHHVPTWIPVNNERSIISIYLIVQKREYGAAYVCLLGESPCRHLGIAVDYLHCMQICLFPSYHHHEVSFFSMYLPLQYFS